MNGSSTPPASRGKPGITAALFFLLFLLVCAVFHSVVHGEFLAWDDNYNISLNSHLNGLDWNHLRWFFANTDNVARYQPLCWLVWAVIRRCFGPGPYAFHAVVLLFHAVNTGLVFLLIRKLMLAARPPSVDGRATSLCAALAAALWAVHPLRAETTAWAVELVFVQPLFFFLLSLLCYLRAGERAGRWAYWSSVALFIASLASYPLALGGLAVYIALDVLPLRHLSLEPRQWPTPAERLVWLEKIPFAAVTVIFGWVNLLARTRATNFVPSPSLDEFSVTARVMQAFYVWGCAVWKPWQPLGLTALRTELVDFQPFDPPFVLSAILVVGLTVLLFCRRRRWPGIFLVWLCNLALLVPVLGLTEHPHFPADRYSMMVNIGWAVLLGGLFLNLWPRVHLRRVLSVVVIGLIGVLGVLSYRQCQVWRTNAGFFHELLARLPDQPQLASFRLELLMRLATAYRDQRDYSEATETFHEVIREWPQFNQARNELAKTFIQTGDLEAAQAGYREARRLYPNMLLAWNDLGVAYAQSGKFDAAVPMFSEALRDQPGDPIYLRNLANALLMEGKTNEAAVYFKKLDDLKIAPPPR